MTKKLITIAVTTGFTVLPGFSVAQQWDGGFSKRMYLSAGAGLSTIKPDTSEVADISVIDDKDTAAFVTLGFDITRRISAEVQYADLGTAALSGDRGIGYIEGSLSGLYYLWNGFGAADYLDYDGLDRRTGLSLYGRAGVGKMTNEASGTDEFAFVRQSDVQVMVGLGLEYALSSGLGVRAEYTSYDSDAVLGGLSVLYRFGGATGAGAIEPVQDTLPQTQPIDLPVTQAPEPLEVEAPQIVSDDVDGDGVSDAFDECMDTVFGTPVGSNGCAMFSGALDGVNFLTSSDTLTDTARLTLNEVADTMNAFPDIRISVEAHTDSQGSDAANLNLSRQRAVAVVRYLTAQGIGIERFEARAFGESQPITDNDTRAGRLLNRRVEFRIIP